MKGRKGSKKRKSNSLNISVVHWLKNDLSNQFSNTVY